MTTTGTNGMNDRWYGLKFVAVWSAIIALSGLFWYGVYLAVITIVG